MTNIQGWCQATNCRRRELLTGVTGQKKLYAQWSNEVYWTMHKNAYAVCIVCL